MDEKKIQVMLAQNMLGINSFYWFGDSINTLPEKTKKNLIEFFCLYRGPNSISFFVDLETNISTYPCTLIAIPSTIDYTDLQLLLSFYGKNIPEKKMALLKKIFARTPSLPLDTCCNILNMLDLVSVQLLDQLFTYLEKSLETQPAFAQLSEYFFSGNASAFFSVWSKVSQEYPEIFWLSYWSEQVWRAYHTKKFLQKNDFVQAKKMGYRLPYSFMNRYWKNFKLQDLSELHEQLYTIDYALKTGSTFCLLDQFYLNHFLKYTQQKGM
ncbi:hypothetical protein K2W90_01795 [Candidatus Babeliales bacterium]|nr:hypothetical protein [Candidatus Babeliales bacterium]